MRRTARGRAVAGVATNAPPSERRRRHTFTKARQQVVNMVIPPRRRFHWTHGRRSIRRPGARSAGRRLDTPAWWAGVAVRREPPPGLLPDGDRTWWPPR